MSNPKSGLSILKKIKHQINPLSQDDVNISLTFLNDK